MNNNIKNFKKQKIIEYNFISQKNLKIGRTLKISSYFLQTTSAKLTSDIVY